MILYFYFVMAISLLVPLAGMPGAPPWAGWGMMCVQSGAGIVGAAFLLWDKRPKRIPVTIWLPLGLAIGRSISLIQAFNLLSIAHVLTAWTVVLALIAASARQQEVILALRWMTLPLLALAIVQAGGNLQNCFMNRNHLGMALIAPLAAWFPERRRISIKEIVGILGVLVGFILSLSRGAMIAAILMSGWYFGLLQIMIPLTIAMAPCLIFLRNPSSIRIHLDYFQTGLISFRQSILLGLGPGRLAGGLEEHAHNIIITIMAWSGLSGLASASYGLVRSWPGLKKLPRWALAAIFGLALSGLVDDWTSHTLIMAMAASCLALEIPTPYLKI